ncbi:SDR family NAD(P)-dependent oxidoreductase [Nocardia asteroides]|uniref:SDR family NAD(P)-dependent oxidoreductase n=1 Tax=Nocardia asteroides TaxID=1824 RepID=UPI00344568D4
MEWPAGEAAFVTGAASGIGLGIARALVAAGAKVALVDIDRAGLAAAAGELATAGGVVVTLAADVSDAEQWHRAVVRAEGMLGPVSILCNTAAARGGGPIDETPLELWRRIHRVNLDAQFIGAATFLPRFKSRGGRAHIVNTAAMSGLVPTVHEAASASSRSAGVGFSMVLRDELAGTGVGVTLVCPGPGIAAGCREGGLTHRVDGDRIGALVLDAMRERRFLLVTDPGWAPLVDGVNAEIERAFAFSEFDGRHGADPVPWLLLAGTNPVTF